MSEIQEDMMCALLAYAIAQSKYQTVEFFVWYSLQYRDSRLANAMRLVFSNSVEFNDRDSDHTVRLNQALELYAKSALHFSDSALMRWIQCHTAVRVGPVEADRAYHELSETGSDANFALNFPAGYIEVAVESDYNGFSVVGKRWVVSKTILFALYGWSFRSNRRKRKPY
ncbi:hypothetical protein PMZ80_005585 [Knufia obscura]|uniref:Uncharacterized protein n=1 Tax=Knufia obscura TaxID=1635080 RepID=A0ABR0RM05_9EURO|nr:hypothetical protein PMZ80_005585 [Knufia obscura]